MKEEVRTSIRRGKMREGKGGEREEKKRERKRITEKRKEQTTKKCRQGKHLKSQNRGVSQKLTKGKINE